MRQWLKLAIWLYPAAWRRRYGREFDALLGDLTPRWRDLWDILRGAITMQLSTPVTYFKLGAATAIVGALVAGGVTFALPKRYVSSAVLRIMPQIPADTDPAQYQMVAAERLQVLQQQVLSRQSLAEIIQKPELDLYRDDRQRYPMEDIIQNMRQHDIRIQTVESRLPFQGSASAFQISFEYSDRKVAQRVVRSLVTRFVDANVITPQSATVQMPAETVPKPLGPLPGFNDDVFAFHPDPLLPLRPVSPASVPAGAAMAVNLEVLDPPGLPGKAIQPDRLGIVAIGLGAGFVLGLIAAFVKRRPLRWILWIAASAIVGFVAFFGLAIATSIAIVADYDIVPFALLGAAAAASIAAYVLRDRAAWRPVPYLKFALATAICASIVAGLSSFAIPEHFVSSAVIRIYRLNAFGVPGPDTTGAVAERLHRMSSEVFSRNSLAEIIQRPALDLYRDEHRRHPMEAIIGDMRRDIRFEAANPSRTAYQIAFEYPDRLKAKAVVRELITKFTETDVTYEYKLAHERGQPGSIVVEVIDPASDPQISVSPDRARYVAIGFAAGIPLGLLIAFLRRRPPGQAAAMLRFATATGAAGAVIAGSVSFAIPSRYISTATLRLRAPEGAAAPDRLATQQIQQRLIEVLSRGSLADLIQRPELNLYQSERASQPMDEVISRMRDHDLRIESLDVAPLEGATTAFTIAFEYPDPVKAHLFVQDLIDKFVEAGISPANLEVLDPPSTPSVPAFPARFPIAAVGLAIGLILGAIAEWLRRQQPYSAAA